MAKKTKTLPQFSPNLSNSQQSEYASAVGYVADFITSQIRIEGSFNPGLEIELHDGQEVFIFTPEALDDFANHIESSTIDRMGD